MDAGALNLVAKQSGSQELCQGCYINLYSTEPVEGMLLGHKLLVNPPTHLMVAFQPNLTRVNQAYPEPIEVQLPLDLLNPCHNLLDLRPQLEFYFKENLSSLAPIPISPSESPSETTFQQHV